MKTIQFYLIIAIIATGFQACNNSTASPSEKSSSAITSEVADHSYSLFINNNYSDWDEKISSARVNFGDFSVIISGLQIWNDEGNPLSTAGNIVNIDISPGENLEEQFVSITEGVLENVLVEQRFETSMLIYGNEKLCELLDWKHFTSEWSPLQKTPKGEFKCAAYSQQERIQFPDFDVKEIKDAVRNHCSDSCYDVIKDATTIDENNSSVRISHYFIRISGKLKSTGEMVQKTIRVYNPAGC